MKKIPKKLYVACVNLSGLYSNKPVTVYYEEGYNFYSSRDGMFVLDTKDAKARERDKTAVQTFYSEDKKEVERWIAGATAALTIVHEWSRIDSYPEKVSRSTKKSKSP